ncbi:MAG TPA: alpha/beta hydrolase [Anaerolineae bacterium]
MPSFEHDGIQFHYDAIGRGTPFILQHGLGGDINQPLGLFHPPQGYRIYAFDCRAHGQTQPIGNPERISFATFVNDLCTFQDHLHIQRCIVGGISMGAGLALGLALRLPERVSGLVLSRPAWLNLPAPSNLAPYAKVVSLIREYGAVQGLACFVETEIYQDIARESPDAAQSLMGQFQNPRAEEAVVRLERIPQDSPMSGDLDELRYIAVPTLVLGTRQDPVHPYTYALQLARAIPCALLHELTPKSVNKEQHAADFQQAVGAFLCTHSLHSNS